MNIVIVGSSSSLLSIKGGEFVDSCDYVIRTNDALFKKQDQKYIGTKTSAWANGMQNKYWKMIHNDGCDYSKIDFWWGDIQAIKYLRGRRGSFKSDHKNRLYTFASKNFASVVSMNTVNSQLCKQYNYMYVDQVRPTTGLITLAYAITVYPEADIYVLGYGVPGNDYAGLYDGKWTYHDIQKEDKILKEWEDAGRFKRLETSL
jgi:hypothetical protein